MMVYRDGIHIYEEDKFSDVDVTILKNQYGETRVVVDDHFSGEQLAEYKVIEVEECTTPQAE